MHPITLHLPVQDTAAAGRDHLRPHLPACHLPLLGEDARLPQVIARTRKMELGGTFAIFLACDCPAPWLPGHHLHL